MRLPFSDEINELDLLNTPIQRLISPQTTDATRMEHIFHSGSILERKLRASLSGSLSMIATYWTEDPSLMPTMSSDRSVGVGNDAADLDTITVGRPEANVQYLDPGLFARDRNPRRKATKLFGEVPVQQPRRQTPQQSSTSKSVVGDRIVVQTKKRKSPLDHHGTSDKRRTRPAPSKFGGRSHIVRTCEVMGEDNVTLATTDAKSIEGAGHESVSLPNSCASLCALPKRNERPDDGPVECLDQPSVSKGTQTLEPFTQPVPMLEILPASSSDVLLKMTTDALKETVHNKLESESSTKDEHTPEMLLSIATEARSEIPLTSDAVLSPEEDHSLAAQCLPMSEPSLRDTIASEVHSAPAQNQSVVSSMYDPLTCPKRDTDGFLDFCEKMKAVLRGRSTLQPPTVATRQAKRILELLEVARPPDEFDAAFVNGPDAMQKLAEQFQGIIVTEGQQLLPLQTIDEFLGEYYNSKTKVWIQDPSIELSQIQPAVRQVTMGQVKKRFASSSSSSSTTPASHTASAPASVPWNLLELATHCDDGLRPAFLNTEDCRLLTKLKIPHSAREARRRTYSPGYKEVEKWALLAQAGALTEPHQDSHGYSTFITVNVGRVGFGWLSRPDAAARAAWCAAPTRFVGRPDDRRGDVHNTTDHAATHIHADPVDNPPSHHSSVDHGSKDSLPLARWRYLVLHPGQTVYFPAGTVHFVFRHPHAGDSLAFGGHVLRCSGLVPWARTLLEERRWPGITNEDITQSAPGYLHQVERFVREAVQTASAPAMAKWGGKEAIEEFLGLKKEFLG